MELAPMRLMMPEQTLDMILEALEDLVQYELAVIMIFDGRDDLSVKKVRGPLSSRKLEDYRISLKERTDIAQIIENRRTYLFKEDEQHLDTYYDVLELPENHSCLVSPLFVGEDLIGLLTLDHRVCNVYSTRVVRFIETLSKLISVYLAQSSASRMLYTQNQDLVRERNFLMDNRSGVLKSLVGTSQLWVPVLDDVRLVAGTDTPVLVQGETGTGKELIARAIHQLSSRASGPFTALNCSTMSPGLSESELFGHERGAFTGAHALRKGRFELAEGGTLFLDEIGDLPIEIQPKLLRVLQEGTFERVGGEQTLSSDVRIIAASHVDLLEAVSQRRFREDLFYRLSVFPIQVPALRDRRDDIHLLAEFFLAQIRERPGWENAQLSDQALKKLLGHGWPGNVRELKNVLERAAIVSRGTVIHPEHLQFPGNPSVPKLQEETGKFLPADLDAVIKRHIEQTLEAAGGRIYGSEGAAAMLGMKPSTLQSRMKRMGIRA